MKKIIYIIIILCLTFIAINIILPNNAFAINDIIEEGNKFIQKGEESEEKIKQEQQEWREQYYHKVIFLEKCMYIVVGILICNIILFSILLYKRKKVDLIYKILQIIFLLLIFILYRMWDDIPGEPYAYRYRVLKILLWQDVWRGILVNFALIEAIVMFITLFVHKKKHLLRGAVLIGLPFLFDIKPSIVLIIITNILFLPLYLSKKEVKEGENVRI